MRGIAEWHVFIPNEAFLVAKSALGPHGAKPPHIHMTQDKSANFFKIRGFHEIWVGLGVDDPHKTAEYLENTLKARLPLVVAGSQSAL